MSAEQAAGRRADYYVLSEADQDSRELFLCRLCERILRLNLRIHVHTASAEDARRLDHHLWGFRADAFVPHGLLGSAEHSPIEIGHGSQRPAHREVFVNLALELPEDAFEFQRIVEIVCQDPAVRNALRHNYQRCQAQGLELETHQIKRSE